ncbi:MAG TPA: class I SAM-dependent methyltransferase [Candidatus Binatia bacterium]|nr:class I SAM-dependent methyltransferase [Candidatus Binatia bacterium]
MDRKLDKRIYRLILLCCLLASCSKLKQWAYQGIDRDRWQQPENVIAALKIREGMQIADLGAGGGYFTFHLAKAAGPSGKVYAVDIDKGTNELIAERAKKDGVNNVETILATAEDPMLPNTGVDLIFTSNVYHHIDNRVTYFTNLGKYLKPGGRIAIIDFDRRAWLEGLLRHYTPSEFIKREMEQAGYKLREEPAFLDRQSFLIFAAKP